MQAHRTQAGRRAFLKFVALTASKPGLKWALGTLAVVPPGAALWSAAEAAATSQPQAVAKRLAMVVDIETCVSQPDCTECITACNQVHNIPTFTDPKREIKWIWKEPYQDAFADVANEFVPATLAGKTIPVLCNQCDNPACVRVCPTQATFRRDDGIVMMDMHRCIGCRFCMAACPFGSRSFNWQDPRLGLDMNHLVSDYPTRTKGVVEKCDFCQERLDVGLNAACVEACPVNALFQGNLNDADSEVARILQSRYSVVRRPDRGTRPQVYYVV